MILYFSNVKRKLEYETVAQNSITYTDDPPKKFECTERRFVSFTIIYYFPQAVMTIVIPMLVNFFIYALHEKRHNLDINFVINVFGKALILSIFHDITDLPSPH